MGVKAMTGAVPERLCDKVIYNAGRSYTSNRNDGLERDISLMYLSTLL